MSNSPNAKIISKQFLGPSTMYLVKTFDGEELKVQTLNTTKGFNEGDSVFIEVT